MLFSYDVDGRTKVAIFAADDVRDWNRDEGWGVRAWAQCDPSELPPDVTDDLNIGVWEDESGRRVPVTRIQSFQGAEHCSWTDITFLLARASDGGDRPIGTCATSGGDFPLAPHGACLRRNAPKLPYDRLRQLEQLWSTGAATAFLECQTPVASTLRTAQSRTAHEHLA